MSEDVKPDIGDEVVSRAGTVRGRLRYFSSDGAWAWVQDAEDRQFYKFPVGFLSKVEEKHDGDGL